MSPIDLGIGQEVLREASKLKPIPTATYAFRVKEIREVETEEGRPGWNCFLEVINDPDSKINGRIIFYRVYFPWTSPVGERKQDDIWKLSALIAGTNSWDLCIDGQLSDKEMFYGRCGFMKVKQQKRQNDPDTIDNVANIIVKG